jgi:hypothetical protein
LCSVILLSESGLSRKSSGNVRHCLASHFGLLRSISVLGGPVVRSRKSNYWSCYRGPLSFQPPGRNFEKLIAYLRSQRISIHAANRLIRRFSVVYLVPSLSTLNISPVVRYTPEPFSFFYYLHSSVGLCSLSSGNNRWMFIYDCSLLIVIIVFLILFLLPLLINDSYH